MIKFLKIFCAAGFLVVLVNNIVSISGWTESRAVYDDICYLRQAHLFERFGFGGIDTDIARNDDHYLQDKLKEIDFKTWDDPTTAPCHTFIPASGKRVLHIGRPEGESKRYYARVPDKGRGDVFVISEADGARIVRDLAALTEKPPKP